MKLIFSRKGFDGRAGGCPSPIIDGQPISLPIPYDNSTISFCDVGLGEIVPNLTNNRIGPADSCHPDPDLKMGAFGQVSAAQSHLKNQNVGSGDLFLFFGWFREAEIVEGRYRYIRGAPNHHRIFGWLFVDKKVTVGSETEKFQQKYPDYADHPHATGPWESNNTIYIAPETFTLPNGRQMPGCGKFCQSNKTLLTGKGESSKRYWAVPDWLNPQKGGCIPSYHSKASYNKGILESARRGQEFVCVPTPQMKEDFEDWLLGIFDGVKTI